MPTSPASAALPVPRSTVSSVQTSQTVAAVNSRQPIDQAAKAIQKSADQPA